MSEKAKNPIRIASKKKLVLIITAAVLLVAILCATLLPVLLDPTVYRYRSLRISEGVFNYLYSYYRARIPGTFGLADTESTWASAYSDTETKGEHYAQVTLDFIEQTVVAARLFDDVSSVSGTARDSIDQAVGKVLDSVAGGDKGKFNELCAQYGFDYNDFRTATTLLYKANRASDVMYGIEGSGISDEILTEEFEKTYIRAQIIFVRTKDKFERDMYGNYITDPETGKYETVELTDDEKAEKQRDIAAIDAEIAAGTFIDNFDTLYNSYSDGDATPGGYYLSEGSAYTLAFGEEFPTVAAACFDMTPGQCRKVESELGTHYILRLELDTDALSDTRLSEYFEDFSAAVAARLFAAEVTAGRARLKVVGTEHIAAVDFVRAPRNKEIVARV